MAKVPVRSFQTPEKHKLRQELEGVRNEIMSLDAGTLMSGEWFQRSFPKTLAHYTAEAPPEGVPDDEAMKDELAMALVAEASRHVAHAGGAISASVAAGEATAIAQGRSVAGRRISGGVASVLAEVLYGFKIDLKLLGYLSAIYQSEVRTDDPLEVLTLVDLALFPEGPDADALLYRKVDAATAGEKVESLVEKATFEEMPERSADALLLDIGARLFKRAVLKTVVPRVSTPLLKGFLCFFTKAFGKIATRKLKKLGVLHRDVASTIKDEIRGERFLLPLVMSMALADGELHEAELAVFRASLTKLEVEDREWDYVNKLVKKTQDEILDELTKLEDPAMKEVFYEALVLTALADGTLHPYERDYIKKVSRVLGFDYDELGLEARLQGYGLT